MEVKFEPAVIEGKKILFKLAIPDEGIEKGTLTITSKVVPNIVGENSDLNMFLDFPKSVSEVNFYKSKAVQAVAIATASSVSKVILAQNIALTVISLPLFVLIVQLFQIIDFIGLINVELPANVEAFIEYFGQNVLTFLTNPVPFSEDITRCQVDDIFSQSDITCITFNNMGTLLLELTALLATKIIFVLITAATTRWILRKGASSEDLPKTFKERTLGQNILFCLYSVKSYLSLEFFSMFLIGCQLDALMGAMAGLRYGDQKNNESSFNYLLACFIFLFYSTFFLFLVVLTIKDYMSAVLKRNQVDKQGKERLERSAVQAMVLESSPEQERRFIVNRNRTAEEESQKSAIEEREKERAFEEETKGKEEKSSTWDFFFEEIKRDFPLPVFIVPMVMFQDLVIAPTIIFNVKTPEWQIIPLLVAYAVVLTFMALTRPFKSYIDNTIVIVTTGFYLVILICLFYLTTASGKKMLEKTRYTYIGNLMILVISLATLVNSVMAFVPIVVAIKDLVCKKEEEKSNGEKKQVKVIDKIGDADMLNDGGDSPENGSQWKLGGRRVEQKKKNQRFGSKNLKKSKNLTKFSDRANQRSKGLPGLLGEKTHKHKDSNQLDLDDPFSLQPEQVQEKINNSSNYLADPNHNKNNEKMDASPTGRKSQNSELAEWNLDTSHKSAGVEEEKEFNMNKKLKGKERKGSINLLGKPKKLMMRKSIGGGLGSNRSELFGKKKKSLVQSKFRKKSEGQILPQKQEDNQEELDVWGLDDE